MRPARFETAKKLDLQIQSDKPMSTVSPSWLFEQSEKEPGHLGEGKGREQT
jgi:hypothetical protein